MSVKYLEENKQKKSEPRNYTISGHIHREINDMPIFSLLRESPTFHSLPPPLLSHILRIANFLFAYSRWLIVVIYLCRYITSIGTEA